MQKIRAITLDLDDTLWEIGPVIRRAEAELWRWLAEHYPAISATYSMEDTVQIRADVVARYAHKSHDYRYLRKAVLERLATGAGYGADLVEAAFSVFDAARNRVELFPDVLPALERLAERYALVALTNGNADLDRIGIRHLFEDVITAAEVGAAKPAPAIFSAALQRSGLLGEAVLHVGDNPELDVAGAARSGMRTAWVNRIGADWPTHLGRPDVTVATMVELSDFLDRSSDI